MIDTHAHLNFKAYENDLYSVIKRARDKGVKKFIVPSSNIETSKKAIEIARKYEEVFVCIGLHPIHSNELSIENLEVLYTLLSSKEVVGVGEIGLDYFYLGKTSYYSRHPNKITQKKVLVEMINLAQDASMPLIFHCREAHKDMLSILKSEKVEKGAIHCFSGEKEDLRGYLNLGLYVSFSGNITYSSQFDDLINFTPLDRLLLETDCPYLAPVPYRGQRNEPSYIIITAKRIAEIKKIPLIKLEQVTDENADKLFKLKKEEI